MSEMKGMLSSCDRCGCTLFRKLVAVEQNDRGYNIWDEFEPYPIGWAHYIGIGLLCPECNDKYLEFLDEFMGRNIPEIKED